jgi:hypothetical protein
VAMKRFAKGKVNVLELYLLVRRRCFSILRDDFKLPNDEIAEEVERNNIFPPLYILQA